jgi:hypothetical protein
MKSSVSTIVACAILFAGLQSPAFASETTNGSPSQAVEAISQLVPATTSVATPQFAILTDYPGRQRAVTEQQKAQIRRLLAKSEANTKFICTGIRLESNPQGMNLAIRQRAKLVCEYAKSLRPDMSFWYQTTPTKARNYNGRVMVFSR